MALDWNLASTWEAEYGLTVRNPAHPLFGQSVGYGRVFAQDYENSVNTELTHFDKRMTEIVKLAGVTASKRILIIGCAFGYAIESLIDKGYVDVWGTDLSQWIHDNKNRIEYEGALPSMRSDVQNVVSNINISDVDATSQFVSFGVPIPGTFDVIITEQLLSGFRGNGLDSFLASINGLLANKGIAIHVITSDIRNDDEYVSRTLEQYRVLEPNHYWMANDAIDIVVGGR